MFHPRKPSEIGALKLCEVDYVETIKNKVTQRVNHTEINIKIYYRDPTDIT
jgi:hypothetical protein